MHFPKWNVWILIKISLKFVPRVPINNIPTLVQIMAWWWLAKRPLSDPNQWLSIYSCIYVSLSLNKLKKFITISVYLSTFFLKLLPIISRGNYGPPITCNPVKPIILGLLAVTLVASVTGDKCLVSHQEWTYNTSRHSAHQTSGHIFSLW